MIWLGAAVIVPEERDVVFANKRLDGDVAAGAGLGIVIKGREVCLPALAVELTRKMKATKNGTLNSVAMA